MTIPIIIGVVVIASALFVMFHVATAPRGWEDSDGFHFDDGEG